MSYCVNCGVELAESEKYCPLCRVEVVNPKEPWKEPVNRPYPTHLETLMERVDRRYFATLAGLLLLIPVFVTILIDLFSGDGMTWSAYTASTMALLYVFIVFPFFFKRNHTIFFLIIDSVAVLLSLLFIEAMGDGHWFKEFGLPITTATSVSVISTVIVFRKKTVSFLLKTAFLFFILGILVTAIELIINIHVFHLLTIRWSFYVLIPCIVLSICAIVLERRKNWKEEIRKRMFH